MIYLDNAATTLRKPPQVGEALLGALNSLGNSARGAHEGSLDAARTVYNARIKLAELFNCPRPDHIIFTSNVTEALNTAICGLVGAGGHVISTDWEHNSVLRPLYRLEREQGVRLDFVPADRRGRLDMGAFERLLRPDTAAIVCTHASNLTGDVMDAAAVGRLARAHGVPFIVDAAQTAGTRPVDMQALEADILCFTGHKGLMGPQGTGGMCVRPGVTLRPLKVGGTGVRSYDRAQPEQFPECLEAGTLNGHGIAGLSAAVDFLNETGLGRVRSREAALTRRFYESVKDIPNLTVYGDFSGDHGPIVALNIGGEDSGRVADALDQDYGIAVRAGAHCAPRLHEVLGTREQGAVRFSFSWFNTEEEVDAAIRAVEELAR
ncbi:MAG: aminotransferase class V-fold PLP-dependent enzyme [Oscillospiraceae bacterium]|nr:aminotransferase class V-fold PLP-dependent enzyme [Oscillospiraceae bacterium]